MLEKKRKNKEIKHPDLAIVFSQLVKYELVFDT